MDPTKTSFGVVVTGVTTCGCAGYTDPIGGFFVAGQINLVNGDMNGTFTLTGPAGGPWEFSDPTPRGTTGYFDVQYCNNTFTVPATACDTQYKIWRHLQLIYVGGTPPNCWAFFFNYNTISFATGVDPHTNIDNSFTAPSFNGSVVSNNNVCATYNPDSNGPVSGSGGTATFT
jgi:hypothetical protein